MTSEVVPPAPAPSRADEWRPRDRSVGRALALAWTVMLLGTVFLGHREATYQDLLADVADGKVTEVAIAGSSGGIGDGSGWDAEPLDVFGGTRTETVHVRWRSGLLAYEAEVLEAAPRRGTRDAGQWTDDVVVQGSVREQLSDRHPDLRVVPGARPTGTFSMWGWSWHVPGGMLLAFLGALVLTLVLIANGPRPWRATRWAWAWVALLAPFGALIYLVLGGPTGLFRPRDTQHVWLTGGWAFLLAVALGTATGA